MKKMLLLCLAVFALICLFASAGCGKKEGASPAKSPSPSKSPQQNTYVNEEIGYSITIPPGWKTPDNAPAGELLMQKQDADFEPKPTFNIFSAKVEKYDLQDPQKQKEIRKELSPDLNVASERNTTVAGQPAYQLIYGVEKDNQSIMICQTYLFNKDYLMVLTGGCKEDKFTATLPEFEKFLSSLELR